LTADEAAQGPVCDNPAGRIDLGQAHGSTFEQADPAARQIVTLRAQGRDQGDHLTGG